MESSKRWRGLPLKDDTLRVFLFIYLVLDFWFLRQSFAIVAQATLEFRIFLPWPLITGIVGIVPDGAFSFDVSNMRCLGDSQVETMES